MQQLVVTPGCSLVSDEPLDAGGDGLGPTPFELLLASLGT